MQILCADLQRPIFHPQLVDLQPFNWKKFHPLCWEKDARNRKKWKAGVSSWCESQ